MNFIFSNFNYIVLAIWVVFFLVVVARIIRPKLIKKVAYKYLVAIAVSIHLLYGVVATWLTYIAWSMPLADGTVNQTGKLLLSVALPNEAPLPVGALEWIRPLFEGTHGYFAGYSFFHYFLGTLALFLITGLFVSFFKLYSYEHNGKLTSDDLYIIALAFLMSGYAGSLVLVPLGLLVAVFYVIVKMTLKKSNHVSIPHSFIVAVPFAFVFAIPLLSFLSLWPLLKL